MNPHAGTIADTAHRMRVFAHQMAAHIDYCLPELSPDQRATLREWPMFVAEAADHLCPMATLVPTEPSFNVVRMPIREVRS